MRINIFHSEVEKLLESDDVVDALGEEAEKVEARVGSIPSRLRMSTRKGKARRGPFSQVVVSGPAAAAWEYGSRNNPPAGKLRGALRP